MFICRTSEDIAESSGEKLAIAFSDWEKAFDKVDLEELIIALDRTGASDEMLEWIGKFYDDPKFKIKHREGKSKYRKPNICIGRGFPLSHIFS